MKPLPPPAHAIPSKRAYDRAAAATPQAVGVAAAQSVPDDDALKPISAHFGGVLAKLRPQ